MRNNLVFTNIPEAPTGTTEDCEKVLKGFLVEKMKIAQDLVTQIQFDRVHRIGPKRGDLRCRNIIALKFTLYKEKEYVRKQWKSLSGTRHQVYEQFPKKIVEKRRQLVPKMKAARRDGKQAWIVYDKLFIDGKQVED
ncbi:uncharacterized protein LOC128549967 [Mercenaria mercenaria]|uniref:uncharacterized protein LOC128549967 n=1 Tax=Mercenaria mercenaria TaxID=6596 RepID=UPI00234F8708|nr:uncharacterized protein LOC128549967 [Mercenaria mercenaria]